MTAVHRPSPLRRAAVLLLLTAGLVLGAALPSWASFTEAVALPQMTVSTPTLAVPGVPTARATCVASTATVTVNWNASTAPRVSGYKVRLWLGAAWQDVTTVTGTTWTGNTSTTYVNDYVMTFTVWTMTPYGWTAESAHTAQVLCS
ncbi:MAG: hypothetical protein JWR45_2151 [Blastococcus sp.]|jgi:hypothetical protein|nr:hypothetical protein [Blastococcus sp.]